MTPAEQDNELREEIYTLDRLREKIDPNMPRIGSVMARVDDIVALITTREKQARCEELERIATANVGNGIHFYFGDMRDKNNGWRTMKQYVAERIAQLKGDKS